MRPALRALGAACSRSTTWDRAAGRLTASTTDFDFRPNQPSDKSCRAQFKAPLVTASPSVGSAIFTPCSELLRGAQRTVQHSAGVQEPSPPSSLQRRTLGEARERPHSAPSSAPQHSHPQRGGRRRAPTAQPATPRAQDAHRSSSAQPGQKKAMKWFCSAQLSSASQKNQNHQQVEANRCPQCDSI